MDEDPGIEALSDGELAQLVCAGEHRARVAEAMLCARFARRVRLYGLRHLGSEQAADDLVQDVLALMMQKLRAGEVREPERIASFVLGSARLLSQQSRRKARREQPLPERFDGEGRAPAEADVFASERLPEAMAQLEPRERSVLLHTYYAEASAAQISEELGLSTGNVRVIRHRAIARLRQLLGAREEESP